MTEAEYEAAYIQAIVMVDGYTAQGESNEFSLNHLAQAYLSFNHLLASDTKVWLGRRYYQRKSIHILNHFWLNPGQNSQAAVGVEYMGVGAGKLDLAVFRSEDNFEVSNTPYLINHTNIDARLHDLPIGKNRSLTVWLGVAHRSSVASLAYRQKLGHGFGLWLDQRAGKIVNTVVMIYQAGSSVTQSDFNPNAVREDQGWNLDEARSWEVSNTLTYESLPRYSYQWTLVYRQADFGVNGPSTLSWYSTGVRPIYCITRHLNVALEADVDVTDDEVNRRQGRLSKYTAALQIAADRGLKSRPVVRFFVTYADWSADFSRLLKLSRMIADLRKLPISILFRIPNQCAV